MHALSRTFIATCLAGALLVSPNARGVDLLPDLFSWAHDTTVDGTPPSQNLMYRGNCDVNTSQSCDTSTVANKVLYRFNAALTNIGEGPLQVIEQTLEVNGEKIEQTITQQVLQDDASFRDVEIGTFPYPPEVPNGFGHLRLPGLAQYNLRAAVPNSTEIPDVGELVASNDKLSMGIVDSIPFNQPVPGAAPKTYFSASAAVLGISVGHADLYGANLPGQWIDVAGLPSGQYWLEVVIDPYGRVLETDETNNSTLVLVDLDIPAPQIHPGDYNDDGTVDSLDYTVWRDTLGESIGRGQGADGDGDGLVTEADYGVWQTRFGETAAAFQLASVEVPEPASGLIMLLLCAGTRLLTLRPAAA